MSEDRRVIACNFIEGTSAVAQGALAYVVRLNPGDGDERIVVLARSRGSRWIEKYENIRRLGNFRAKTLPPEHPRYGESLWDSDVDNSLERLRVAKERVARLSAPS